ncbi:hypothetical protein N9M50_07040 [Alphaproteobacteria bacterium]|jgi:hypothetical protein|nr:hypothetical protein [Alphaproteobacteria bacterium]
MPDNSNLPDVSAWTPELLRQRRRRAAVMAIGILILVGLFFAVTIVRLAENVAQSAGQS